MIYLFIDEKASNICCKNVSHFERSEERIDFSMFQILSAARNVLFLQLYFYLFISVTTFSSRRSVPILTYYGTSKDR